MRGNHSSKLEMGQVPKEGLVDSEDMVFLPLLPKAKRQPHQCHNGCLYARYSKGLLIYFVHSLGNIASYLQVRN